MAKEKDLSLYYTGDIHPAAMEARELIQILAAFTRVTTKANRTYYGASTKTSVHITHVSPGTINLGWIIETAAVTQPAFAALPSLALGVSDVASLVKAWLDLLKFLKGQPPQKVQTVTNGNALQLENVSGQNIIVNGNVYNTFTLNGIGSDAEKLKLPVRKGAKNLELRRNGRRISSYSRDDLANFQAIKPSDKPLESEIEAILEVVSPVLDGDGMWRFKYGRMSITAKLIDDEYKRKIESREESFSHGDRLNVQLRTIQENLGDRISTKHFVSKVIRRI